MFDPVEYHYGSDDSDSDVSLDSSSTSNRDSMNSEISESLPDSGRSESISAEEIKEDITDSKLNSKPSFRVEERVTDENKPSHTYWELLDDDEKTNLELKLAAEESKDDLVEVEEEKGGPSNENNNQDDKKVRTENLWHEMHLNDLDEETFLWKWAKLVQYIFDTNMFHGQL